MSKVYFDIHGNPHECPEDVGPIWRVSVYGIAINDKNEILAVRAKATKKWELPGGGVDIEETVEDALLREFFEETGYRVEKIETNPQLVDSNFFRLSSKEYCHAVRAYFHVRVLGEQETTIIDPDEVTEIAWLAMDNLNENEWKDTAWHVVRSLINR